MENKLCIPPRFETACGRQAHPSLVGMCKVWLYEARRRLAAFLRIFCLFVAVPCVTGAWPLSPDIGDIVSCHRSRSNRILATGDDQGRLRLFRYPAVEKRVRNRWSHATPSLA